MYVKLYRYIKIIFLVIFVTTFTKCTKDNSFTGLKFSINKNNWRFKKQNVVDAMKPGYNDSNWLNVSIPHDWNGGIDGVNFDVFTGPNMYMGPAWYRVNFTLDKKYKNKQIQIKFEAASLMAEVWLNGKFIGKHKGGYTAFTFNITNNVLFDKENLLAVKVSNKNDSTIAPWMYEPFGKFPNSSDYAIYGGIYRDVWIEIKNNINISQTFISTPKISAKEGIVKIKSILKNKSNTEQTIVIKNTILDKNKKIIAASEVEQSIDINKPEVIDKEIKVVNPTLWSIENPYLYTVKTTISIDGKIVDETANKFGIRNFNLENGKAFTLNGKKIFLRGINMHQDREGFGYALTDKQHVEDIKLIKEYGFNFLRHAHYPADEAVLDACDSLGIVVWLEIPVSTCISEQPEFLENAKSQLQEMIEQYFNHPSIIIWSLGNESDRAKSSTEKYSNMFFNKLNQIAHQLDSTRPTGGCNFMYESNQKIVDVYAPQDWSGWYDNVEHGYKGYKPTQIIGEYGASIHLPNHNEYGKEKKWSQEYGALLHEFKVSKGEALSDSFPGHAAWVAFDFASPRRDRGTNAIPYMNIKGLFLHDHKTPKDVAYFYKSFYTDGKVTPMVYIVSKTWKDRVKAPSKKTIWVYSNCDEVELFNDYGKTSFGKRKRTAGPRGDTRFQWDNVLINNNVLYAEGIVNNHIVATDTLIFNSFSSKKIGK